MIATPVAETHTIKRTFTLTDGPVYNEIRVKAVVVVYTYTGSRWTPTLPSDILVIGNVIGKRGAPTTRRRREKITAAEHDRMHIAIPWLHELISIYAPHGTVVAQHRPYALAGQEVGG